MKPRLYLETTIPSYLAARPSRDFTVMAKQQLTKRWWDEGRHDFEVFISREVLDECAAGETGMAAARLDLLKGIPLIEPSGFQDVAKSLLVGVPLPPQAASDAVHLAVAAIHSADFLLTWNCKHLANARLWLRMRSVLRNAGLVMPFICTPEQLGELK